jgi:hemoglobin
LTLATTVSPPGKETSMRRSLALSCALTLAVPLLVGGTPGVASAQSADSLYKRLGGYDAIAAVTDDFIARALADPKINRFFDGMSTDSKQRFRQRLVEQLCAAAGGPCVYTGRSMKASHAGVGITEADWTTTVNYLVATLDHSRSPRRRRAS